MGRSLHFYVDVLGSTFGERSPAYADLRRDEVRLMLATPNDHEP